jgi:hypothetical protein
MTCDSVQKAIPLYLYGELPGDTEEEVEAHMANCPDCTEHVEMHREFARNLSDHELEPPLDLLVECRRSLAVELKKQEKSPVPGALSALWDRIFGFPVNNFRVPAGAMAVFALGFFAARTPQLNSVLPGNVQTAGLVSTVRSIEPDRTGRILISVDDTQRRTISGTLQDPKILPLLLAAMREESNPGVRVESVSVAKDLAGSEDVREALLDRLQHDPNPGVRLKALEGLGQFGYEPGVRQALTTVLLTDANVGVRIQAIDLLTSRHDDSLAGLFQSLVHKDDNDYVRFRCVRALREMNASIGSY